MSTRRARGRSHSAGILLFKATPVELEVLLAHPGVPYARARLHGVWGIPKGRVEAGEEPLATALREFREEIGLDPHPPFHALGSVKQAGKVISVWASEGNVDPSTLQSQIVTTEIPAGSGNWVEHPEVDQVGWFRLCEAKSRIVGAQRVFLDRLREFVPQGRAHHRTNFG